MKKKRILLFCINLFFGLSAYLYAQAWSGILAPTRAVDWSQSGIPGGIPNRTTICATIGASSYGNGTSDATAGIQTALNSCATGQVVFLTAGTYRINGTITIPSNVTLRGAGSLSTILDAFTKSGAVIRFGASDGPWSLQAVSVSSGTASGSRSIVVSDATNFSIGKYMLITELNDSSFVYITNNGGTCTYCDTYWNGTRARGQIVEITSVSGTTIGFTPALYSAYSNTPQAIPFAAGTANAGVENLQVHANNSGQTKNFLMSGTAYCWIKGVYSNYCDGDHAQALWSYRGEIRNSYFTGAYNHSAGTTDSDVMIASKTSGFLVENNIFERMHVSLLINWGAAGNVFGYNYSTATFGNQVEFFLASDIMFHGAHPQFNLFEGNIAATFHPDPIHGSASHNTAFRNWFIGTTPVCVPYSDTGSRGAIQWNNCNYSVQAVRGIQIDKMNKYYNLVGNVVGASWVMRLNKYNNSAYPMTHVSLVVAPTNRSYGDDTYSYTFGYGEGAADTGTEPGDSSDAYTTALIHGDYDNVTSAARWTSGVTQTLPASFYLSAKPSWFGTVPWPPIGPDVTGGIGPGGHTYNIPAKACYDATPKDSWGQLMFNPDACYGGLSGQPGVPQNLKIIP